MGVKGLNVRDRYAAEARDEHAIKLDKVLYIIIALVNIKTSKYLSKKKRSLKQSSRLKKKKINKSYVSFDIVIFAIYGKNNCNLDVDEIQEFFQFPKGDICISTARCKCTIYIFTYKSIKKVKCDHRSKFSNLSNWKEEA